MIPDAYCAERVRDAGGDPDLIARFAPNEQRAALTALAALRGELEHLVEQHHDPAIAAAKLAWWRGELGAFANGEARHPATRALLAAGSDRVTLGAAMLAFSAALEVELGGRCLLDPVEWRALLAARGGWHRALSTVGPGVSADAFEPTTLALAELEILATLGRRLSTSRPALDAGWGLAQTAFVERSDTALELVSTRAQVAGATLATQHETTRRGPLAVAAALGARRARALAADPSRAWRNEPRTSLGALFTAWRAAL